MADETAQSSRGMPEEPMLPNAEPNELEAKLAECEKKRDEYLSGWQRAKADFLNYKKEEVARLEEIAKYGAEDLMEELIHVLDSFDLGIASLEKQGPVEKGIYMIRVQLEDMLKRRGLTRIEVRTGDVFDPSIAEAVGQAESELPPGAIVEEIEAGYRLHERILRPVRVKVSKGQAAKSKP